MNKIIIDIETSLNTTLLNNAEDEGLVTLPIVEDMEDIRNVIIKKVESKYKKQETVDKHLADLDNLAEKESAKQVSVYDSALNQFKTHPLFTMIDIITISDNGNIYQMSLNTHTEKQMLEHTFDLIVKTMKTNGIIFTFNGKKFDFPIMIARAEALYASVDTMYLETLCKPSSWQHQDLYEPYKFGGHKYTSLSMQLFARYGIKKVEIDFDSCTLEEKEEYAMDEMTKFQIWVDAKVKYLESQQIK